MPQRERCTQGHAKRETAMFYFINPDITKHDGIGAASYFEVEDLNQKSVKIKGYTHPAFCAYYEKRKEEGKSVLYMEC